MRTRNNKSKSSKVVAATLGRLYNSLHEMLSRGPACNCGYYDEEDIFQETMLYVIQDTSAAKLKTDPELIKHFQYRFRMIKFQIVKESQQLKETGYADNIQTNKDATEE